MPGEEIFMPVSGSEGLRCRDHDWNSRVLVRAPWISLPELQKPGEQAGEIRHLLIHPGSLIPGGVG